MSGTTPSFLLSTTDDILFQDLERIKTSFSISAINIGPKYQQVKQIPPIHEFDKDLRAASLVDKRNIILKNILNDEEIQPQKKHKHENVEKTKSPIQQKTMDVDLLSCSSPPTITEEKEVDITIDESEQEPVVEECEYIKTLLSMNHIIPVYDYREHSCIEFPSNCFSWIIILLNSYIILGKIFDSCIIFDFDNTQKIPETIAFLNRHANVKENIFSHYTFFYNAKLQKYQKEAAVSTIQNFYTYIESLAQPMLKLKHFYSTLSIDMFQTADHPSKEDFLSHSNLYVRNIERIRQDSLMFSYLNNSFSHK